MNSGLYARGRQAFAEALISWLADDIQCVLLDLTVYKVDRATHQFLSDIPGGARIGVVQTLEGKTTDDGVLDALDVTFPRLRGPQCGAIAIWKKADSDSTSRLICYIDDADGLPVLPHGGNAIVAWDNGPNRIARL